MRPSRSRLRPGGALALAALTLVSACSAASVDGVPPSSEPARTINTDPDLDRIGRDYEIFISNLVDRVVQDKRIRRDAIEAILGAELLPKPVPNGRLPEWELHGPLFQKDGFRVELRPAEQGLELAISNPLDNGKACYLQAARIRSLLTGKWGYKATELGIGKRPYTLLTQNDPPAPSPVSVSLFERKPSFADGASQNCVYALKLTAAGD